MRNASADLAALKVELEDENARKNELQKLLTNANVEAQQWRAKYETEGVARAEELEEAKRRLSAKLHDAEEQMEAALAKCSSLEKSKCRLQTEMDDLMADVERVNANASSMEKKQKHFDRLISDWKTKCDSITAELEASQKEARLFSGESFKLKSQYQEAQEAIETVRVENKNLAEEVRDLCEQLSASARNAHELEKAKKHIEAQKDELQSALESSESALEQAEAKIVLAQFEITNTRQETERRIADKEEEFNNTRYLTFQIIIIS